MDVVARAYPSPGGGCTHRMGDDFVRLLAYGEFRLMTAIDSTRNAPPSGPLARWPRTTDAVLAAAVFVLSVLFVTVSALPDGGDLTWRALGGQPIRAIVILAIAAGVLVWRRSRPVAITMVVIGLLILWAVLGHGDGQELALVVAAYSLGRYEADHRIGLIVMIAALFVDVAGTVIDTNQRIDVVPAAAITLAPWYVGRRVRNRGVYLVLLRERADRVEADQQARTKQALADERSRIARELHDIVAHRVSMMTVQAGAARTVAPHDLDTAVEAMADVERAGRMALGELRHLVGVLRPEVDDPEHLGPQPELSDVQALADELTHTGAKVTLAIGELPDGLPAALQLSAYRIIQEAVTNVMKHAGPAPEVDIAVDVVTESDGRWLTIEVMNTIGPVPPGLPISGFGLVGMRERATLLGGTFDAGETSTGRYRVSARLPVEAERP